MKIQEFKKVAEMLAKEHKTSIEPGARWAANIQKRIVYYVNNDILNLSEDHILGLLLHEIAHIHYTTETKEPTKNKELLHSTLNMLEDISIENIISKDYPNAGEILESTKKEVLDTLIKMLPAMEGISKQEKALLFSAARFEDRGCKEGTRDYEVVGLKVEKVMKDTENKKLILGRKETKELLPMAEKIVKIILDDLGDLTDQEKENMQQNKENGETAAEHGLMNEQAEKGAKEKLIDGLKAGTGWKGNEKIADQGIKLINEVVDQSDQVGKKLRTVLKRNNAMEYGGRYRTGKLVTKSFLRIRALRDRNPFTRRIVKSNQSYAFAIASDVSGSMRGNYLDYATSSLLMVANALRYAAVPRAIIIFAQNAVKIKEMSKSQIRWEDIAEKKKLFEANCGGTSIHKAMEVATKELDKATAERKIMLILTDGSSDQSLMSEEYQKATKKGIECLGITLGDQDYGVMQNVFGKNNIKIQDTSDPNKIAQAFINVLKSTIKKSNT